jgi:hypothetical protein
LSAIVDDVLADKNDSDQSVDVGDLLVKSSLD